MSSSIELPSGVRYLLVNFADLSGVMRSKLVPVSAIGQLLRAGAAFAGFAANFDLSPADADVVVHVDASTLKVLPWQSDVAWVTGDVFMDGCPLEQAPRNVLKKCLRAVENDGLYLKTGVEAEFFLLSGDSLQISDRLDSQAKPCYDQLALMRRFEFVSEICDALEQLGWEPYQGDHEDANGQFEINWAYCGALETADRHAFFKFAVRSLAEKHGFRATFMPKPFAHLTGNGCHVHLSLWDGADRNLFRKSNEGDGLSEIGKQFIAGLMQHASSLCALTNPTVNSFKRLNATMTDSGATWSPAAISYAGNNRSHLIRIPDSERCELRLPDGATNPYLLQAAVLCAGMSGVMHALDPGAMSNGNAYANEGSTRSTLPPDLRSALEHLRVNDELRLLLGTGFVDSYLNVKYRELRSYMASVGEWEIAHTLDC